MASMDIFKSDAFSMMSLIKAIENVDFKPQLLGSLRLFDAPPEAPRSRTVAVESIDNTLALIPTSPIGAPPAQLSGEKRKVRNFTTTRLAKQSRINAEQIQGIRAFGSESELQMVQAEVARRLARLMNDLELTWEFHRLGAVQGLLVDADNSTLYNYFTEFGVVQPSVVEFSFSTSALQGVRATVEDSIVRPMLRAAKGAFTVGTRIIALCGDDFWDQFVNSEDVRETYRNWEAAAALREGTVFSTFRFAGVEWINYRGTDDESTVAIGSSDVKFFPVGAPDVFQVAWAPAEFMDTVNQPGVPVVPKILPDPSGRDAFVDVEIYSYPLHICTKPLTLRRGTLAT